MTVFKVEGELLSVQASYNDLHTQIEELRDANKQFKEVNDFMSEKLEVCSCCEIYIHSNVWNCFQIIILIN